MGGSESREPEIDIHNGSATNEVKVIPPPGPPLEVKIELNGKVEELKGFKRKKWVKGRHRLKSYLEGCRKRKKAKEENHRVSKIKMRGKKRLIVSDAVHEPVGAGAESVLVIEEDRGRHIICCLNLLWNKDKSFS